MPRELAKPKPVDFLLSPHAVRQQAARIYELAQQGQTHFSLHPEKLPEVAAYVHRVIKHNYPDNNVPYHSRWRHFEVGNHQQLRSFHQHCAGLNPQERAKLGLELILPSVLVDAGAGDKWQYASRNSATVGRSEGLALASLDMFLQGGFSHNGTMATTAEGLQNISVAGFEKYFNVSPSNLLLGVSGRVQLLQQLGGVIASQPAIFPTQRLGDLLNYISARFGQQPTAPQLLALILNLFSDIWPGRLHLNGKNLGDTWRYPPLANPEHGEHSDLVPFHKLSQWISYSVIETLENSDFTIPELNQLTGLAEYRNGGLMLDSGLIQLRDPKLAAQSWPPASELIIEWRALTIHLLDQLAATLCDTLQLSSTAFPLAKVLEGGTWAAGRQLAMEKRGNLNPPLNIASDATVF